jgi:hypothetical protein
MVAAVMTMAEKAAVDGNDGEGGGRDGSGGNGDDREGGGRQ